MKFAGGGVDGDTLQNTAMTIGVCLPRVDGARCIQATDRDERGFGGKGSPLIRMTNKLGKTELLQSVMLRSSPTAQAGSTPARQHQIPH